MKIKALILVSIIALVVGGCEDPYKNSTFTAFEEVPAATYLKEHPETFSLWTEMIEKAGLFRTLNLERTYTIFAPNDSAVSIYLANHGYSSVADVEKADAAYIVKYHLLTGIAFDQSQFQNGAIPKATETDDDLSIEFREGGINSIYLNGESRFVTLDIEVTNGIIHEIESVLEPITVTVDDVLKANYSIFHEAVVATGYNTELARVEQIDTLEGVVSSKRFQFTVFAVNDSVYNANGISDFNALVSQLSAGSDYTSPDNALHKYISYHTLKTLKSGADLATFPSGQTSTNINTSAENQIINISVQNGTLMLNYDEVAAKGVQIQLYNIACRNGVIHEVDNWMPLFTPPPVTVLWDLADQSDLATLCSSFQRSDLTGDNYTRSFVKGELTSYTWQSSPMDQEGVVVYRNSRSNDGIFYFALNYDHMRITTGASGWVETTTPVIIRGDYKITLGYISQRATANSGIMLASLDGRQLGSQLITSNASQDERREHVLTELFTFSETTSHTLRIVGVDGKLLTLDYLRFEPVE